MKVRLLGGVEGRSTNVAPEKAINLFYEKGTNGEALINTPGASLFKDVGNGEVRGAIAYNSKVFAVVGNTLYEINSAGTATSRGTLNTSSGLVSMVDNGVRSGANQQIFIADGTQRYIYDNTTSTLTGYTDYAAERVVFIDGYFLFTISDSDRVYQTNLYDGATVTSTDFFTAEGSPDETRGIVASDREFIVFGEQTLEAFYNSGDTDNTFQRYQGGFKQMGCAARHTPNRFDNTVAWLTQNERGYCQVAALAQGFNPTIISSPELDHELSTYTTVSDAFSYVYQYEGNEFYTLVFPTEKKTWAMNARTKLWHQEAHTISGVFPNRVRYNCHVFAFGKHLMGDMDNGKLYELDSTIGTVDSVRIPREITTPNITEEEERIRVSRVQLDMEEGTGDPNSSTDTTIWLSYAKDGSHNYSNEISSDIGDAGEYRKRVIWRRLGWGRNWTFKIRTWTPNKVVMKALYVRPYGQR